MEIRHKIEKFVVYFDQHLGSAHCKRLLKYSFSTFFVQKTLENEVKERKLRQNSAKMFFM